MGLGKMGGGRMDERTKRRGSGRMASRQRQARQRVPMAGRRTGVEKEQRLGWPRQDGPGLAISGMAYAGLQPPLQRQGRGGMGGTGWTLTRTQRVAWVGTTDAGVWEWCGLLSYCTGTRCSLPDTAETALRQNRTKNKLANHYAKKKKRLGSCFSVGKPARARRRCRL